MKYYTKVTYAFKWARELQRKTETYESAKCVPCNTLNGFVSDLLKWALKCRFYATGPRKHVYLRDVKNATGRSCRLIKVWLYM